MSGQDNGNENGKNNQPNSQNNGNNNNNKNNQNSNRGNQGQPKGNGGNSSPSGNQANPKSGGNLNNNNNGQFGNRQGNNPPRPNGFGQPRNQGGSGNGGHQLGGQNRSPQGSGSQGNGQHTPHTNSGLGQSGGGGQSSKPDGDQNHLNSGGQNDHGGNQKPGSGSPKGLAGPQGKSGGGNSNGGAGGALKDKAAGKVVNKLPGPAKKAAKLVGKLHNATSNLAVRIAKRFGISEKAARILVNCFMLTGVGGGGIYLMSSSANTNPKDTVFMCNTRNDSGNGYFGDDDLTKLQYEKIDPVTGTKIPTPLKKLEKHSYDKLDNPIPGKTFAQWNTPTDSKWRIVQWSKDNNNKMINSKKAYDHDLPKYYCWQLFKQQHGNDDAKAAQSGDNWVTYAKVLKKIPANTDVTHSKWLPLIPKKDLKYEEVGKPSHTVIKTKKKIYIFQKKKFLATSYTLTYELYRAAKMNHLDDYHTAAIVGNAYVDSMFPKGTNKLPQKLQTKIKPFHNSKKIGDNLPWFFDLAYEPLLNEYHNQHPAKRPEGSRENLSFYNQVKMLLDDPNAGKVVYQDVDASQRLTHNGHTPVYNLRLNRDAYQNMERTPPTGVQGSLSFLTGSFEESFEGLPLGGYTNQRNNASREVLANYSSMTQDLQYDLKNADKNTAASEKLNNIECNTFGYGDKGSDDGIILMARHFLHKVPYNQGHRRDTRIGSDGQTIMIHGNSDTSAGGVADSGSFTWWVFKQCGYDMPSIPWTGQDLAEGKDDGYVKLIKANDAKKGDLVMIDKHIGHGNYSCMALLMQNWHGQDTMVIGEGGSQSNVNISTFGEFTKPTFHNGKLRFYRPIIRGDK